MKQECYSNAVGQSVCPPFQLHYKHSWVHPSSSSRQFLWGCLSKFLEFQFLSSSIRRINCICTVTLHQKLTNRVNTTLLSSRFAFLQKLVFTQQVRKIPTFYRTWEFTTVITSTPIASLLKQLNPVYTFQFSPRSFKVVTCLEAFHPLHVLCYISRILKEETFNSRPYL
jgi:hypothetical protein